MFGIFVLPTRKASIFIVDRVRTNQMPNMSSLYQTERTSRLARFQGYPVPPAEFTFEIRVETELRRVSWVGGNTGLGTKRVSWVGGLGTKEGRLGGWEYRAGY
jgi:hypothetical protein